MANNFYEVSDIDTVSEILTIEILELLTFTLIEFNEMVLNQRTKTVFNPGIYAICYISTKFLYWNWWRTTEEKTMKVLSKNVE